ncbi:unnamed protein product [Hydatigera taeniaeformis]|uniref:DH domain-containing protein n=1 Tax=Hydatigena taeniaeformis TaxID=6205 RepID=A0A0R3X121_HYDTA|nr:unnamed protein product [Hydatigera taeniaeformis]
MDSFHAGPNAPPPLPKKNTRFISPDDLIVVGNLPSDPQRYRGRAQTSPPPLPKRHFSSYCPNVPTKTSIYKMDEKMETQRSNVVRELIENEKLFNKQMVTVSDIMTKNRVPIPISPADLAAVKLNLDDYIQTSAQMVSAYTNAVAEAPNGQLAYACVCKHLVPILPAFRDAMVAYIKDFDPQILQHRPHLVQYFEKAGELLQSLEGEFTLLSDRLLKPFQRPFHITCILHRLDKYTPDFHADSAYVKQANIAIQRACDDAEATKHWDAECECVDCFVHAYCLCSCNLRNPLRVGCDGSARVSYNACGGHLTNPLPVAFCLALMQQENSRMTNYRKKRTKLYNLIDDLSKWIKLNSEDLKSFIETRRLLIKAAHMLLQSLDSTLGKFSLLDFHASSVQHRVSDSNPVMFDRATKEVLDRLKLLSVPLRKMKPSLKKLKSRGNDIARTRRNKTVSQAMINAYRLDEERAMALSEKILGKTEKAVKALFLHYLAHVQRVFYFVAIKENGLVERYSSAPVRLLEADVSKQVEIVLTIWERQINMMQSPYSQPILQTAPCRARIVHLYSDSQTPSNLQVNDIVYVFQWTDTMGNSEWAGVRDATGRQFFYPSAWLQRLI